MTSIRGGVYCLNIDKTAPDFTGDWKEGPNWNADTVFNFAAYNNADHSGLRSILCEETSIDTMGNK